MKPCVLEDLNNTNPKLSIDRSLFTFAFNFSPRNGYYSKTSEQLNELEILIDSNLKSDFTFTLATAWYMGKVHNRRLFPVIALTRILFKSTKLEKDMVWAIVKDVYNRPDLIADSLQYTKDMKKCNSIAFVHGYYKVFLKHMLENFTEDTLTHFKMLNRKVKLKDLIKILRPTPKNSKMSSLYKDIIQDGPLSKIDTSGPCVDKVFTINPPVPIFPDQQSWLIYKNNLIGDFLNRVDKLSIIMPKDTNIKYKKQT